MTYTVSDILEDGRQIDVRAVHGVEVQIQKDGLVVWVNIDGVCAMRILSNGFVPLKVEDMRCKQAI